MNIIRGELLQKFPRAPSKIFRQKRKGVVARAPKRSRDSPFFQLHLKFCGISVENFRIYMLYFSMDALCRKVKSLRLRNVDKNEPHEAALSRGIFMDAFLGHSLLTSNCYCCMSAQSPENIHKIQNDKHDENSQNRADYPPKAQLLSCFL